MAYRLRPGLRFCRCAGRTVFLDVAGDRYFCLPSSLEGDFQSWVAAQSDPGATPSARLLALGLFAETAATLEDRPVALPIPSADLDDGAHGSIAWMLWAVAEQWAARLRLRRQSLARIVERLERGPSDPVSAPAHDRDHGKVAVAFARSRLFAHSWDNCLSQSLAFHRVCQRLRLGARLVIGVRLDPFAAHCWVQHGEVVLNDSLERVRPYTPILVA